MFLAAEAAVIEAVVAEAAAVETVVERVKVSGLGAVALRVDPVKGDPYSKGNTPYLVTWGPSFRKICTRRDKIP